MASTLTRRVSLEARSLDLLLYDWLSELIYRKDRDREVFTSARVSLQGNGPFRLEAKVMGGAIERGSTVLRADPKAVTFHQFALGAVNGGWRARVVIDV